VQKTKKVLFNQKKVRTFAPDFAREKHRFFKEIDSYGEVGEWLKPTVC
jgi:hypothetical protein